ncbi:hypothetical protein ACNUDN_05541 [Mycobacterium sp. smrl_JER01]
MHGITDEFVTRLAQRAAEAERLRRLPAETIREFKDSGLPNLLLPRKFGGVQASFAELLDPVRVKSRDVVYDVVV